MTRDPQLLASEPCLSASVRANAGSGKTWTLIARVARLLLADARPEAILCVTYTKAAAAEMQRRLFKTLGEWAVMDDGALAAELAKYDERADDLSAARKLFARALETPGGLKIQTIHAFCEKLLRRFPLEAGVSPGFEVLDDATAAGLAGQARDELALLAGAGLEGLLGQAYARMAVRIDARGFNTMLAAFVRYRDRLAALVEAGELEATVERLCDINPSLSDAQIVGPAMAAISLDVLRLAADLLAASGGKTDQTCSVALYAFIEMHMAVGAGFEAAIAVFATAKGEPRRHYETSAVLRAQARVHQDLLAIRDQLFEARAALQAAEIARDSLAVMRLGLTYAALYHAAKQIHGGLDFDDLINRTRALLTTRSGSAWVLYKLDGGIDHILLDEAQDTAGGQWDILRALANEFFSGAGLPRDVTGRTVFFVGDEKQSIYGFNGAAPERLLTETAQYADLALGAGRAFEPIALNKSRRSAPEVLGFIDAVSNIPEVKAGLLPGSASDAPIVHEHHRTDPGCVELWPLEVADPAEEVDPWLPVDADPPASANKKLAQRIAAEVARLIAAGEGTAGDVMILVRRRKALFEEIIRALKQKGVPVAGADRLKLSGHIGFQDLLALARFCLYPSDDLTLAALLRSPFCDVDEESLYALAQGRDGHLWTALDHRAEEHAAWSAAHAFLSWTKACAARLSPFDFYGRILNRLDANGQSMRARLLTRLGAEAADVIDAFMAQALSIEQSGAHALEAFVAALGAAEIEIKREQDEAQGVVRVMTVHGAKGLEAPIVILPDTTTLARVANDPLFDVDSAFLWAPRADEDTDAVAQARQTRKQLNTDESMRLLYVAMTRARDRLIVAGVVLGNRKAGLDEGCWYDLVARAFDDTAITPNTRDVALGGAQARRYGPNPAGAWIAETQAASTSSPAPSWLRRPHTPDAPGPRFVSPSALAEGQAVDVAASPLARRNGLSRFRRGELIHRLLQLLPDIAPADRRMAAQALLDRELDLAPAQRSEMIAAAFGVLDDARFAAVFGPGSRAEVAVAGQARTLPPNLAVGGRLDRLVVEPNRVLVVDFKTNRPAPETIDDADPAYVTQMAAYTAVLAEAFPGRAIEAALVWTDGPKLMAVPENMLLNALARLALTS